MTLPTRTQKQIQDLEHAKKLFEMYPLGSMCFSIEDFAEISAMIESGNGFDPCNHTTLPSKLMLVVTELVEAVDWCRSGDGDPLSEELADVMIRLLAMVYRYTKLVRGESYEMVWKYSDLFVSRVHDDIPGMRFNGSIEESLWPIVRLLAVAMEKFRHAEYEQTLLAMERALEFTAEVADSIGINWKEAIKLKTKKNLQRPYLHGKVISV